ncbi:hypothetical protein SH611_03600 [Geminicoccaceae bacterium 1502E]|uniref:Uncharacterized protein n=1 Tax=Marinimicrococcus flavescens TaxID=3031815 RepID=A0AAP3UYG0_9PROT|nr:hypothetical protein [Marinimicrococcus flavescens]MDX6748885.1 hypothetical protein [Geminicoccaceae bacterium 1502E]
MTQDEREASDPDYRPWSWIAGLLFGFGLIAVMFELALTVGG